MDMIKYTQKTKKKGVFGVLGRALYRLCKNIHSSLPPVTCYLSSVFLCLIVSAALGVLCANAADWQQWDWSNGEYYFADGQLAPPAAEVELSTISGGPEVHNSFSGTGDGNVLFGSTVTLDTETISMLSLWHMDESGGATTISDSAGSNDGSSYGFSPGVAGKFSNGITFTGGKYLDVGRVANFTSDFSVCGWVKTAGGSRPLWNNGDNTGSNFIQLHVNSSNKAVFFVEGNGYSATATGTTSLNDSAWHLLCGVWDHSAKTAAIYVDDTRENSAANTNVSFGSFSDVGYIGYNHGSGTGTYASHGIPMNGTISYRSYFKGVRFTVSSDAVITRATRIAGGNPTIARLKPLTGNTTLAQGSFSGDNATLTYPLIAGVDYRMEAGSNNYIFKYNNDTAESWPYSSGIVTMSSVSEDGADSGSSIAVLAGFNVRTRSLSSFTVDEIGVFNQAITGPATNCTADPDNYVCFFNNSGTGRTLDSAPYLSSGVFTSNLVTTSVVSWDKIMWSGSNSGGSTVSVRVKPSGGSWTALGTLGPGTDVDADGTSIAAAIGSNDFQYELTLTAGSGNTTASIVNSVTIGYKLYPTGQFPSQAKDGNTLFLNRFDGNLTGSDSEAGTASDSRNVVTTKLENGMFGEAVFIDDGLTQLLPNADFSDGTNTDADEWTEGTGHTRSVEKSIYGSYSVRADAAGTTISAFSVGVNLASGIQYILSAYVRNGMTGGNAYIDLDNGGCRAWSANNIDAWQRVVCAYTPASNVTDVKIRLVTDGTPSGEVYFDAVQLEVSSLSGNPPAAANSGFETGTPDNWTLTGHTHNTSSANSMVGTDSISAAAAGNTLSDSITVLASSRYTLSGFIKNNLTAGRAYLDLNNDGNFTECEAFSTLEGNNVWERVSCEFTTGGSTSLQVRAVTYGIITGTAWFDEINITPTPMQYAGRIGSDSLTYAASGEILTGSGTAGDGSIEMWIKAPWNGSDGVSHYLFDMRETDADTNAITLEKTSGNNLRFRVADSSASAYREISTSAASFTADTWHYIAATWDGGSALTLYLDGSSIGSASGSGNAYITTAAVNFYVGTDAATPANHCNCLIDELRISDKVRDATEILAAWNAVNGGYTLISKVKDAGNASARITGLSWNEGAGEKLAIQLRTAPDIGGISGECIPGTWSSWYGPDDAYPYFYHVTDGTDAATGCTKSGTLVTCATIPTVLQDYENDQCMQYKVILSASLTAATPQLQDITITYDTIGAAVFSPSVALSINEVTAASVTATLTFTSSYAVPPNGDIEVVFPGGFDISGVTNGNIGTGNGSCGGASSLTKESDSSGQRLVINCQGGVAAAAGVNITIANITNPSSLGTTGSYTVETQDSNDNILETKTGVAGNTLHGYPLTSDADTAISSVYLTGAAATDKTDVILGTFKLTGTAENISITRIDLTASLSGMAIGALSNVEIIRDNDGNGAVNGADAAISSSATSTNPVQVTVSESISSGVSYNYIIRADLASASIDGGDTIQFTTAEPAFSTANSGGDQTKSGTFTSGVLMASGALNVEDATTTISSGNLGGVGSVGSTDTVLTTFKLTAAGEAVTVSQIDLTAVLGTMTISELTNVKIIRDNGAGGGTANNGIVDGSEGVIANGTVASPGSTTISFTSLSETVTGSVEYIITANIASAVTGGDTVHIDIASAGDVIGTGDISSENPINSTGTVTGYTHTVSGTLSLGNAATVVSANTLIGAGGAGVSDVVLTTFNLGVGDEPVTVSQIDLTAVLGNMVIGELTNVKIIRDNGAGGGTANNGAVDGSEAAIGTVATPGSTTISFTSLGESVSGSTDYIVTANLAGSISGNDTIRINALKTGFTATGSTSGGTASATGSDVTGYEHKVSGSVALSAPTPQVVNGLTRDAVTTPADNELTGFKLTAAGENINFTDLSLDISYFGGADNTFFDTFRLVRDTGTIGTYEAESTVATGALTTAPDRLTFTGITGDMVSTGTPVDYLVIFNAAQQLSVGHGIKGTITGSSGLTAAGAASALSAVSSGSVTGPENKASGDLVLSGSDTPVTNQLNAKGGVRPTDEELIGFKLTGSTWESTTFSGLTITLSGTVPFTNLENFRLYKDVGTTVGAFDGSDNLLATLLPNATGSTVTFPGFSDPVTDAGTNYLIIYDFDAVATATVGNTLSAAIAGSAVTAAGAISGGVSMPSGSDVTEPVHTVTGTLVVGNPTSQPANSLAGDHNSASLDNELAGFSLNASGEDVNSMNMVVDCTGCTIDFANLSNFELYIDTDTDGVYDSPTDTAVSVTTVTVDTVLKTVTFNDFTVSGNKEYLIIFDANASIAAGETIKAVISMANISGTGATSSASIDISGIDVSSEPQHTVTGAMALSGINQPANGLKHTGGVGASGVALIGFNLAAGAGENITVSEVKVDLTLGGAITGKLSGFELYEFTDSDAGNDYDSGEETGGPVAGSLGGSTVTFSTVGSTINAGTNKYYIVRFTLANSALGNETITGSVPTANITATGSVSTPITFNAAGSNVSPSDPHHKVSGPLTLSSQSVTVNSLEYEAGASSADNELIGFTLESKGETVNITQIDIDLSFLNGMTYGNVNNFQLYTDINTSGAFDGESPAIAQDLTLGSNTVTFSGSPLIALAKDTPTKYIVTFTATTGANVPNQRITGILEMVDITSTGNDSSLSITVSQSGNLTGPAHISTGDIKLSDPAAQVSANSLVSLADYTGSNNENLALATFKLQALQENMTFSQIIVNLTYGGSMDQTKLENFDLYLDGGSAANAWDATDTVVITGVDDVFVSGSNYTVTFSPSSGNIITAGTTNRYLIVFDAKDGASGPVGGDSITAVSIARANITAAGGTSSQTISATGTADLSAALNHKASGTLASGTDATYNPANNSVGVYQTQETVIAAVTLTATGEAVNLSSFNLAFTALGSPVAALGSGGDLTTVRIYKESGAGAGWNPSGGSADSPLRADYVDLATSVTYTATQNQLLAKDTQTTYYITATGSATLAENDGIKLDIADAGISTTGNGSSIAITSTPAFSGSSVIAPGAISITGITLSNQNAGNSPTTVTVVGTTSNDIASGGIMKITFPTGNTFGLASATASGTAGISASCSSGCASGNVVNVPVTSNFTAGSFTIEISNVVNPSVSGDPGTWDVTSTDSGDNIIDKVIDVAGTDIISTGDFAAGPAISFNNTAAGASDFVTLTFTPTNSIPNSGSVQVTFPVNVGDSSLLGAASPVGTLFDLSTVATITGTNITDGSTTFTTGGITLSGANNHILTFTVNSSQIDGSDSLSFKIENTGNPGITGDLGSMDVETFDGSSTSIESGTISSAGTGSITNGSFSAGPAVTINSGTAGASDYIDVAFTITNPIPASGKIGITFPTTLASGFGLTAISSVTGDCTTYADSGNVLTVTCASAITAATASPTAVSLRINNVKNPEITGTIGTFEVRTYDNSGTPVLINQATSITPSPAAIGTPNVLSGTPNVEPVSKVIGAAGDVTVTFTTTNPIPPTGTIKVTFPTGFTVPSSGLTATSGALDDTLLTATSSGQIVTITRDGTGTSKTGALDVTIASTIANPTVIGASAAYTILTTDSGGNPIDQDTAVAADTFKGEFTSIAISSEVDAVPTYSGTEWAIGRPGTITWSTTDSSGANAIDNVRIVYYTDDDAAERDVISSTTDDGSYSWTPTEATFAMLTLNSGDPQADPDDQVYIKIYDATNSGNAQGSSVIASSFKAFFYKVQWTVRDEDFTTSLLNALTVSGDSGWTTSTTNRDSAETGASAVTLGTTHYYPYGTSYASSWSKDGYICNSTIGCGGVWAADADKTGAGAIIVNMKNTSIKISYAVKLSVVYDDINDAIDVTAHLTEDGLIVTKSKLDSTGYTISVNTYGPSDPVTALNATDMSNAITPGTDGVFKSMIYKPSAETPADPALSAGSTYIVKGSITYKSKTYNDAVTFSIPSTGTYSVSIEPMYDSVNDAIKAKVWLEKGGTVVDDTPTSLTFVVTPDTPSGTIAVSAYDAATDTYTATWTPTGAGTVSTTEMYTLTGTITYNTRTYTGNAVFSRTDAPAIGEISTEMSNQLGILRTNLAGDVSGDLTTQLGTQTTSITDNVSSYMDTNIKPATDKLAALETTIGTMKDNVISILEDTGTTLEDKIKNIDPSTSGTGSEILNKNSVVKTGETIKIRYRTKTGLKPVMDVYNALHKRVATNLPMGEITGTGVYEYKLKLFPIWGVGDFTIMSSESTTGTMDAMILTVTSQSIEESVASIKDTVDNIESSIDDTDTNIDGLSERLDAILGQLSTIYTNTVGSSSDGITDMAGKIDEVKTELAGMSADIAEIKADGTGGTGSGQDNQASAVTLDTMYDALVQLSGEIKDNQAREGIDMEGMYDIADENADNIIYLMNKTSELKALLEVNQKLLDKSVNKPIIRTWFERE